MKTKIFLLITLLVSLHSFGQETYKSFINDGITKWLYFSPQDGCLMDEIDAYGDTIINQLNYKKLWSVLFNPEPPYLNVNQQWREYSQFNTSRNAFIRQSNDSSKLYLYDGINNVEYLISDMNLKVGDEFIFPIYGPDTVENIIYKDGLKNIQFKYRQTAGGKFTFIESVGHNLFILTGTGFSFPPNVLICYSNSSYFFNEEYYICACMEDKLDEIKTNKYKISKFSDLIEISFSELANMEWEMFDIYGRKILNSGYVNHQKIQLSTTNFINGIYFLRVYDKGINKFTLIKLNI